MKRLHSLVFQIKPDQFLTSSSLRNLNPPSAILQFLLPHFKPHPMKSRVLSASALLTRKQRKGLLPGKGYHSFAFDDGGMADGVDYGPLRSNE